MIHEPVYTYWFICQGPKGGAAAEDCGVFGCVFKLECGGGCESGIMLAALDFIGAGEGDW
jgi:hypothetical protein